MVKQTPRPDLTTLLCFNTYALHHAFGRYYAASFGETGFTYAKFLILAAMAERGPLSLGELSSAIGVEANSISPTVKKMANFGVIDRVRDPGDERRIVLSLTAFGAELLDAAWATIAQGWDDLGLNAAEVARAAEVLDVARARLEQATPPPFTFPKKSEAG